MVERLRLLQAQDVLLLLRHCFAIPSLAYPDRHFVPAPEQNGGLATRDYAIPKVLHVFRSSPSPALPYLEDFDDLLRRILNDIINVRLESGSWLQVSLWD